MQKPTELLTLKQLQCSRQDNILFTNLSVALTAGTVLLVEGANGSGKTTLLKTLAGLIRDYQGEIFWRQQCIHAKISDYSSERLHIGHTPGIKDGLTVIENIKLSLSLGRAKQHSDIQRTMQSLGVEHLQHKPAKQLSAGQRRRVALTRLELLDAKLWLLDEPFAALDSVAIKTIETLILQHAQHGGIVVLTSHQAVNLTQTKMIRVKL